MFGDRNNSRKCLPLPVLLSASPQPHNAVRQLAIPHTPSFAVPPESTQIFNSPGEFSFVLQVMLQFSSFLFGSGNGTLFFSISSFFSPATFTFFSLFYFALFSSFFAVSQLPTTPRTKKSVFLLLRLLFLPLSRPLFLPSVYLSPPVFSSTAPSPSAAKLWPSTVNLQLPTQLVFLSFSSGFFPLFSELFILLSS